MSVHIAKSFIGWRTSSGSGHNYHVGLWKGKGKAREAPRFRIEVNVL